MISFPHAKINLGLHIAGKWKASETSDTTTGKSKGLPAAEAGKIKKPSAPFDGYHTIETILVPVKLNDILEVVDSKNDQTRIFTSGLPIAGDPDENLCMKAYHLLAAETSGLPPVSIYLHKNIPPGAGLGGGSANAAYMLRLLIKHFNLKIDRESLFNLAIRLGSDCPFFLQDQPMIATGTGHILEETAIGQLQNKYLVIIVPPIHISTAWAYSQVKLRKTQVISLKSLCQQPINTWQGKLENDFEPVVTVQYPKLRQIKHYLEYMGAIYTSLTGSGSGIYGIFSSAPSPYAIKQIFSDCHVFCTEPAVC